MKYAVACILPFDKLKIHINGEEKEVKLGGEPHFYVPVFSSKEVAEEWQWAQGRPGLELIPMPQKDDDAGL